MTPIGHSLFGASVGVVCMPELKTTRAKAALLAAFALLANVPDFALPGWGHDRYQVSHSLFINLSLIAAIVAVLRLRRRAWRELGSTPVVLGGAAAWLSHLLLDSFYNHGRGIAMFWPFSSARLALPLPWLGFLESNPPPLNAHTLEVCLVELGSFGLILSAAVYWRFRLFPRLARRGIPEPDIGGGPGLR
jgi:membrane-bound metal-dependent hydrolase YbcI (DUF457 family)